LPDARTPGVLAPLLRAVVFAYVIFPLIQLAQSWRVLRRHRVLAIALAYLVVLAGLTAVGFVVGPRLRTSQPALAQKLPEMSEQVQTGEIVDKVLQTRKPSSVAWRRPRRRSCRGSPARGSSSSCRSSPSSS
jgi:predicted PurR-regulated permease PerM